MDSDHSDDEREAGRGRDGARGAASQLPVFTARGVWSLKREWLAAVDRLRLPLSYRENSHKEQLCLEYIDGFRRQFEEIFPDRRPLFLTALNEAGVPKFVCTTLRPTLLPYKDVYDLPTIARFVARFFTYEPLEDPTAPPAYLPSPASVLERRRGDCFDLAAVLASLLVGAGFDAYCVHGTAPAWITLGDQGLVPADFAVPAIPEPTAGYKRSAADAKYTRVVKPAEAIPDRYRPKPAPTLESRYDKFLDEKRRRDAERDELEAEEWRKYASDDEEEHRLRWVAGPEPGPLAFGVTGVAPIDENDDPLAGRRVHCWVLVRPGMRGIETPVFVEPSTGAVTPVAESAYLAVESLWNHRNYFVNMQSQDLVPAPRGTGGAGGSVGGGALDGGLSLAGSSSVGSGGLDAGGSVGGGGGRAGSLDFADGAAGGGSAAAGSSSRFAGVYRPGRYFEDPRRVKEALGEWKYELGPLEASKQKVLDMLRAAPTRPEAGTAANTTMPLFDASTSSDALSGSATATGGATTGTGFASPGGAGGATAGAEGFGSPKPASGAALGVGTTTAGMAATAANAAKGLSGTTGSLDRRPAGPLAALSLDLTISDDWEFVFVVPPGDSIVSGTGTAGLSIAGGGSGAGGGGGGGGSGGGGGGGGGGVDGGPGSGDDFFGSSFGGGGATSGAGGGSAMGGGATPGGARVRTRGDNIFADAASGADGGGGGSGGGGGVDGSGSAGGATGGGGGGGSGAGAGSGGASGSDYEADGSHVLDLPAPWSQPLHVMRRDVEFGHGLGPSGSRTTLYRRAKLEEFSPFAHPKGLVQKYTQFQDDARLSVAQVIEVFAKRSDKLRLRIRRPTEFLVEEFYEPGRDRGDGLRVLREILGERRETEFYTPARVDGLRRRVEIFGRKILEYYDAGATRNRLEYRSVTFGEPVAVPTPTFGAVGSGADGGGGGGGTSGGAVASGSVPGSVGGGTTRGRTAATSSAGAARMGTAASASGTAATAGGSMLGRGTAPGTTAGGLTAATAAATSSSSSSSAARDRISAGLMTSGGAPVTAAEVLANSAGRTLEATGGVYIVRKMAEKYARNPDKPAHEDIAKVKFLCSDAEIEVRYHLAPSRVVASSCRYLATEEGGGMEMLTVDPFAPVPPRFRVEEDFRAAVALQKLCFDESRDRQKRCTFQLLRDLEQEARDLRLERDLFEIAAQRASEGVAVEEGKESSAADSDQPFDYLAPFLLGVRDPFAMTYDEARDVQARCERALKQRHMERMNVIQRRLDAEEESFQRRQKEFARTRSEGGEQDPEFEREAAEAMFRIGILTQRLRRQDKLFHDKLLELAATFRVDPRLAVLYKRGGDTSGPGGYAGAALGMMSSGGGGGGGGLASRLASAAAASAASSGAGRTRAAPTASPTPARTSAMRSAR